MRPGWLAALCLLTGCSSLPTSDGGVAYLEVEMPLNPAVQVGATLQLRARALDHDRNPVEGITVQWRTPDNTITLDTASGLVTGASPGPARVQAFVGTGALVSDFLSLTVTAAP